MLRLRHDKIKRSYWATKINFNFYELALPDDDSVYTLKK